MLKGKAMDVDDLEDYKFMISIFKVCELQPEAYRLQVKGTGKRPADTSVACARYLDETLVTIVCDY